MLVINKTVSYSVAKMNRSSSDLNKVGDVVTASIYSIDKGTTRA